VRDLAAELDRLGGQHRDAIRQRCTEIVRTLTGGIDGSISSAELVQAVVGAVAPLDPARVWLLLAVLGGRYPDGGQVAAVARGAELDGTEAMVLATLAEVELTM